MKLRFSIRWWKMVPIYFQGRIRERLLVSKNSEF